MSQITVGKWGKNLAVRVPFEIARAAGLNNGEHVEIETHNGDIVIHRPVVHARADAQAAAEEIVAESGNYRLGSTIIRELLVEGRRG